MSVTADSCYHIDCVPEGLILELLILLNKPNELSFCRVRTPCLHFVTAVLGAMNSMGFMFLANFRDFQHVEMFVHGWT